MKNFYDKITMVKITIRHENGKTIVTVSDHEDSMEFLGDICVNNQTLIREFYRLKNINTTHKSTRDFPKFVVGFIMSFGICYIVSSFFEPPVQNVHGSVIM